MQSPSPSEPQSSTEHRLRQELIAQGRFLDGLVRSLGAVSAGLDSAAVLEHTGGRGAAPVHRRCRAGAGAGRGRALAAPGGRRRAGAGPAGRRPRAAWMPRAPRWPWPRAIWWGPSPARPRPVRRGHAAVCVRGHCWRCRWWWPAACTRCWCCSTCTAATASGPTTWPGPRCSPTSPHAPPRAPRCSSGWRRCWRRPASARANGPSSRAGSCRPSRRSGGVCRRSCTTARCRRCRAST